MWIIKHTFTALGIILAFFSGIIQFLPVTFPLYNYFKSFNLTSVILTFVFFIFAIIIELFERKINLLSATQPVSTLTKAYSAFSKLVEKNPNLRSFHLYSFSYSLDDESKYIKFKLKNTFNEMDDNYEINAVQQIFYSIPFDLYNELDKWIDIKLKLSKELFNLRNESYFDKNIEDEILERLKFHIDKLKLISEKIRKELIELTDVTPEACVLYKIYESVIMQINMREDGNLNLVVLDDLLLENAALEKKLRTFKKTGMVSPLIFRDPSLFKNYREGFKTSRIYYVNRLIIDNKNYIALISIYEGGLKSLKDLEKLCNNFDFELNRIQKSLT